MNNKFKWLKVNIPVVSLLNLIGIRVREKDPKEI